MPFSRYTAIAAFTLLGYLSAPASCAPAVVCTQDGWNLAMSQFSAEASPYCSDLLNIPAVTETIATTTPVVTSIPTSTTFFVITVRASGTRTVTQAITSVVALGAAPSRVARRNLPAKDVVWVQRAYQAAAANAVALRRRQANSTEATQDEEDSLSSLSSACTCLRVATTTFSVTATAATSTRIISAVDQLETTTTLFSATVFTTVTVTATTSPSSTGPSSSMSMTAGNSSTVSSTSSAASTILSSRPPTTTNGTVSAVSTATSTDPSTSETIDSASQTGLDTELPTSDATTSASPTATETDAHSSMNATEVHSFILNSTRTRPSYGSLTAASNSSTSDILSTVTSTEFVEPTITTTVTGGPLLNTSSAFSALAANTTTTAPPSSTTSTCLFTSPVENGGFETLLDDGTFPPWQVRTSSDTIRFEVVPGTFDSPAFSGGRHGQVISTGPDDQVLLTQNLTVCPDTVYEFRGWARIPIQNSNCMVEVRMDSYPVAYMSDNNLAQAYGEISGTFGPVPITSLGLQVLVSCPGPSNGIVDLDDFELVARD